MVNYRRNYVKGGSYFFTATLKDRKSKLLVEHIDLLREAFLHTQQILPYKTIAMVVLPDHIHALWELPSTDINYPGRWRSIKSYFSRGLKKRGLTLHKNEQGEYLLWQRRYWEHTIQDERDLETHVDYIHYNPVKHGLVQAAVDWPYSTFHKYVKNEILEANWGIAETEKNEARFGE